MSSLRLRALTILRLVLAALLYPTSVGAQAKPIVFKGARLIDGTGRAPIEDSVLIIEGSKIRAVGKVGSVRTMCAVHRLSAIASRHYLRQIPAST
jgi:hypothetical protein